MVTKERGRYMRGFEVVVNACMNCFDIKTELWNSHNALTFVNLSLLTELLSHHD
jgi:hypothetical protein